MINGCKTLDVSGLPGKVSVLDTMGSVVRVAVETSEAQIEVELVPTVELMHSWPKKAHWPRLLKRWPPADRVRCIKVRKPEKLSHDQGSGRSIAR